MADFYLIFKNLTRKKLRFALLLISITISFLIYVVLSAFQNAMDAGIDLSADDRLVVVNKINFTQPLPYSYYNRIKSVENVISIIHLNWFGGYYQEPKNIVISFAISNQDFLTVYDELYSLSSEAWSNYTKNRTGILVGKDIAERFGWKIGDTIPLSSNIFSNKNGNKAWEFTVEAIFDAKDPNLPTQEVYFHYNYFNESITFGRDAIGFIILRTADPAMNEQVIANIDALFVNSPAETETMPEKAFNKQFVEQLGNISLIIQSVVGAAFFTILMLVGNSMVMAIRERTAEIAILKTLGFSSRRIFLMVLIESLLLSLIGGLLGLAVGANIIPLLNDMTAGQLPPMMFSDSLILLTIAFILLLGLFTGAVPAWNALRLKVIDALNRG